uniref:Glucosylceramidase n=1 Tax=Panagrolaimus sp. JU765 TaxID=591449 RepID=A0AC34RD61_9BILA
MIENDQNVENDDEINLSSEIYSKNKKSTSKKKGIVNVQPNIDGLGGKYGWIVRGDQKPIEKRVPFTKPTFKQICNSLPFIWRYSFFWLKNIHQREKLFINTYQPLKHRPFYGVPCGGIGSGSIGRDFRGAFCKFSLRPGFVEQKSNPVKADQFILNVSKEGKTIKQIVLSSAFVGNEPTLNSWDFCFPKENLAYRGLYPRSWTKYDFPDLKLRIILRQVSPIIPNNYKDSSFPGSIFVFDVENNSDEAYDVSIIFTFRNGTGKRRQNEDAACSTSEFQTKEVSGVLLKQKIDRMDCIYSIAGKLTNDVEISNCTGFDPNGNGKIFWNSLSENCGKLQGKIENCSTGIGLSLSSKIESSKTVKMEFSLVWHMPTVYFGTRKRPLKRWYTRHFGILPDSAITISEYGLKNYSEWEKQIDEWQSPILEHLNIPNWFKSALFNELYFLSDAWEYRMINTYDVHFYASFALAELFPKLEHVLQAEMTDNIHNAEEKLVKFHMEGDVAPIKTYHRVPHDLGNPAKDPWMFTNAYVMHNTALWKDLNLKFILTSYRDYYLILDKSNEFLSFIWPTIKTLIEEGLKNWDRDNDGMIENFGLADQTYDAWRMIGVSSYCGSLWLASLRVAVEMAKDVGDDEHFKKYMEILEMAKKVFDEKLWNGRYYNFDESASCSRTVMADQLCGYWYLQSINPDLVQDLLPKEHVQSSLE